jgi:hypothetical protein
VSVLEAPAIEEDFRRPIRNEVAIAVRNEQKLRGRPDKHAAETRFDAAGEVQSFHENRARFERSVAVAIAEHDDAVAPLALRLLVRVAEAFQNPESSGLVYGEGDGLDHVGFRRDQFCLESVGQHHAGDGLAGGWITDGTRWSRVGLEVPEDRTFLLTAAGCLREIRGGVMEEKVVEVQVSPWAAAVVDEADEDGVSGEGAEVDDFAAHGFRVVARGGMEDLAGFGSHDFGADAAGVAAAPDEEAGPRMRGRERRGGE